MRDLSLGLRRGVLVATVLLGAGTVALASLPPRPLRSVLTLVHTLSLPVATHWLAVVALLSLAERLDGPGRADRRAVRRLAAAVFAGGLAIEASPLVGYVLDPASVETATLVTRLAAAVQGALFPAGLFAATGLGALAMCERATAEGRGHGGLPLASGDDLAQALAPAVGPVLRVMAAVGAFGASAVALSRLAAGEPYAVLVVADAGTGAVGRVGLYAVVAIALLALVARGPSARTIVVGTVAVWTALFLSGIAGAIAGALLGVGLVGVTITPMAAVEASSLGRWPDPMGWARFLRTGTFLAAGLGLWAIQTWTPDGGIGSRSGPDGVETAGSRTDEPE